MREHRKLIQAILQSWAVLAPDCCVLCRPIARWLSCLGMPEAQDYTKGERACLPALTPQQTLYRPSPLLPYRRTLQAISTQFWLTLFCSTSTCKMTLHEGCHDCICLRNIFLLTNSSAYAALAAKLEKILVCCMAFTYLLLTLLVYYMSYRSNPWKYWRGVFCSIASTWPWSFVQIWTPLSFHTINKHRACIELTISFSTMHWVGRRLQKTFLTTPSSAQV